LVTKLIYCGVLTAKLTPLGKTKIDRLRKRSILFLSRI